MAGGGGYPPLPDEQGFLRVPVMNVLCRLPPLGGGGKAEGEKGGTWMPRSLGSRGRIVDGWRGWLAIVLLLFRSSLFVHV